MLKLGIIVILIQFMLLFSQPHLSKQQLLSKRLGGPLMNDSVKELDFVSLETKFDTVCKDVNENGESVVLTLNSGRQVFLMPEEKYDEISHFMIKTVSAGTLI